MPENPWDLPGRERSLAAALAAHWREDKISAFKVLDRLSRSWDPETGRVDESAADSLRSSFERPKKGLEDSFELDRHASYVNVWFMGLLKLARSKGVLPASLWIWLKPTNRLLFYALNQVGGRAAWVEAAGPWSHFGAEAEVGKPLVEPRLESAAAGLARSLISEGWLPRDAAEEFEERTSRRSPSIVLEKPPVSPARVFDETARRAERSTGDSNRRETETETKALESDERGEADGDFDGFEVDPSADLEAENFVEPFFSLDDLETASSSEEDEKTDFFASGERSSFDSEPNEEEPDIS
jgi:hypothetical protein